jgi:hypothetical protein
MANILLVLNSPEVLAVVQDAPLLAQEEINAKLRAYVNGLMSEGKDAVEILEPCKTMARSLVYTAKADAERDEVEQLQDKWFSTIPDKTPADARKEFARLFPNNAVFDVIAERREKSLHRIEREMKRRKKEGTLPTSTQFFRMLSDEGYIAAAAKKFAEYPSETVDDRVIIDLRSLRGGQVVVIDQHFLRYFKTLAFVGLTFENKSLCFWQRVEIGRTGEYRNEKRQVSDLVNDVWKKLDEDHQNILDVWEHHHRGLRRAAISTRTAQSLDFVNKVLDAKQPESLAHLSDYQRDLNLRTGGLDLLFPALPEVVVDEVEPVPTDPAEIERECHELFIEMMAKVPKGKAKDGSTTDLRDCKATVAAVLQGIQDNLIRKSKDGASENLLRELRAFVSMLKVFNSEDPEMPWQDKSNVMRTDKGPLEALSCEAPTVNEDGELEYDSPVYGQKKRYVHRYLDNHGKVKAGYAGRGSGPASDDPESFVEHSYTREGSGNTNIDVFNDDLKDDPRKKTKKVSIDDKTAVITKDTRPRRIAEELADEEKGGEQ